MFADASMGARIDRAEARMCAEFARNARNPEVPPLVLPISGGLAVYAAPRSPINKVIGLGFDTPLDLDALGAIEEQWRERGEPVRIELSVLTDPEIGGILTDRGYRLHGFENLLGRTVNGPQAETFGPDLTVDVIHNDAEKEMWLDIGVEAFMNLDGTGSPPDDSMPREQLREAIGQFTDVPGVIRYLARLGGEPVGEAAMRIDGDIAQIAGAGTLPACRGRGVQKALLQRRLNDAHAAGCTLAVVTTAPGTRSQDNVMRRGFVLLYARAVLVREWQEDRL